MRRRFVLLDRDGTLNVERNYLADADLLELLPGVGAALQSLSRLGLGLAVLTNQSGLARGYFDLPTLTNVHVRLEKLLAEVGVFLAGIYVCPHGPDDGCTCRKPAPGLALRAAAELGFDPAEAFVIGDKASDVELGQAIGATTILVRTGYGEQTLHTGNVTADFTARDLGEAAAWISTRSRGTTE